jgi:L-alanine-DL-glutamate epimerase-like enolase superfamily enzyme
MSSFLLPFQLKNRNVFRIAHGNRTETSTLLLQIDKDGYTGIGEAAHVPYYGISVEQSVKQIQEAWKELYPLVGKGFEAFWEKANLLLKGNHFALCSLDLAHHDWQSKKIRKSLAENLNVDISKTPVSSFTIGIDTAEAMSQVMKSSDFPAFKIKLGSEDDESLIKALREKSDKPFRIDVNGGWDLHYALKMIPVLEEIGGIEFLEQPLAKQIIEENRFIKEVIKVPLFADETCMFKEDVPKVAPYFNGINIKLSKCGGITPALKMIQEARELGLKIMLGCMTESSAGISAMAHLAALVDFVDMDGANMITNDPVDGVIVKAGMAEFKNRNGHGGLIKDEFLKKGIITL